MPRSSSEVSSQAQATCGLLRGFSAFAEAGETFLREVAERSIHKRLPADVMTSLQGTQCHSFPIVLRGTARVFTMGASGREITLYRLSPGEGCVLAASSILSGLPLPAFAVTETEGDCLKVPSATFLDWFDRQAFWRRFVFSLIAHNLAIVIAVTTATTFRRLDARVASHLLEASNGEAKTTHQAIALELGSSREVISRVLKSFEVEGLVELRRGAVRFLDRDGLVAKSKLV